MAYSKKDDDLTDFSQIAAQASLANQTSGSLNIVRAEIPSEEDSADGSLRPKMLDEFLGQKEIKENLSVFIQKQTGFVSVS